VTQKQRSFLVTGRTTAPLPAGKGNEKLCATIRTAYPRKSFLQIPAFDKLVNRLAYYRPPITILLLKLFRIDLLELIEIIAYQGEKW
jgi:hypothetical protein